MHWCVSTITVELRRFARVGPPKGNGPLKALGVIQTKSTVRAQADSECGWGIARLGEYAWLGKWLGFAVLMAGGLVCRGLQPTTPLASFGRQSWVMENGLPQNTVQALVQTRDGFVWLGTEAGLVRFDGSAFVVFDRNSNPALPGTDVRCLLEDKEGALWIGTSEGLARWKNGVVTTFTTREGLPGSNIRAVMEGGDGTLWVNADGSWARLAGDRFQLTIKLSAIDTVINLFATSLANGAKVVGSATKVDVDFGNRISIFSVGKELPGSRIQTLFGDREGCLWIGTNGGLARFASGKVQTLPVTDPLASASILSLLEDREGNLWVGTETGGLHILRDERFRTLGTREGLSSDATTTVVEDSAGTLWVGTNGNGLNAMPAIGMGNGKAKTYTVRDGLLSDVILSLATAANGDLWVGTPDGLNRIHKGSIDSFTSADGLPDDFIRSLLADADGSLWIGTRRGLTHWTGGSSAMHLQTLTQSSGLGSDLVGAMARDTKGNLWVATLAGLSRLEENKQGSYNVTNFTSADGLSSNVVTALLARDDGTLLIGTQDHGWNLWDGQKLAPVSRNGMEQTSIHAILDDGGNHLWFATANGIARCDCDMSGGLLALDGVWPRRRAAEPRDSDEQPPVGMALARRVAVVCHAEGTGGSRSGALPCQCDSSTGGTGALCRGRCRPGFAGGGRHR